MLPEKLTTPIASSTRFLLMQKDHEVAMISWKPELALPMRLVDVFEKNRLPLPVIYNEGLGRQAGLNSWIEHRSIPSSRFLDIKKLTNISACSPIEFALQHYGLSLSDSYWFCPVGSNFKWRDVNLFTNDFERIYISDPQLYEHIQHLSPFASTNGDLRKFWCIDNGSRYLYKESRKPFYQQAYNEAFATALLNELKIPHVPYSIKDVDGIPYSVCPAFTDENTEYVPAWYILSAAKKHGYESDYTYYLSCVNTVYPQFDVTSLHTMLAFDYLICNTDRHYGNFGFLRDVETLDWKGVAPIFDNGTSLWHDTVTHRINRTNQESKPFFKTFEEQNLNLRSLLPVFSDLSDDFVLQAAQKIFSQSPDFDQDRITALGKAVIDGKKQLQLLHDLDLTGHFMNAARQARRTFNKRKNGLHH